MLLACHRTGPTGRPGRPQRRRQNDHYLPAAAAVRPDRRPHLPDGHDLRDISQKSLARRLVWSPRKPTCSTIRSRLTCSMPDPRRPRQKSRACQAANIYHFITSLPDGYDTVVVSGLRLSGWGEAADCHRRVILKNPRILVLDEATSSPTARARPHPGGAGTDYAKPHQHCHRSPSQHHPGPDVILVINEGRLVEQGRRSEPLGPREPAGQGGLYAACTGPVPGDYGGG